MLITHLPTLEHVLDQHADAIGRDRPAYSNHIYRMINFTLALLGSEPDEETLEKLAIAGAFHDIGVWADRTFDYLDPSERRAMDYLDQIGKPEWKREIGLMVQQHHKITALPAEAGVLAEAFRKADWVDVLHGLVSCGIPRATFKEVFARFPDAGFHLLLLKVSGKRLLTHPWSPVPILRW